MISKIKLLLVSKPLS